jgi:predicted nucleic acid-binding protein
MHWTKDPANKAKLARAAAKRARTRKKRGRRSAASAEAVRYGAKNGVVIGAIRAELRDAEKRVSALRGILRKCSRL